MTERFKTKFGVFLMCQIDKNDSVPPTSNRGAQNTDQSGFRSLVDWFSFTLKNVQTPQEVIQILGLEEEDFFETKIGGKGYMSQLRFGNISIYYNGKENMGIHVEISGQGCRQFETTSYLSWSRLFALLMNFDYNITRLDLAVDDFTGLLKLQTIKRKIRDTLVTSRFKSAIEIRKTKLADGSSMGDTVYFGSGQSMIQVRFYDKKLEQLHEKNKDLEQGLENWVRVEVQTRDDRAQTLAEILAFESHTVGQAVRGILSNYIRFLVKGHQKNKTYWNTAPFWEKFLNNVEKLGLTQVAPDRSIQRTYNWIEKQVNPAFALLYEAFNKDSELLYELLHDGYSRMDKKHLEVLNRWNKENNYKQITFEEFKYKRQKTMNKLKKLTFKEWQKKIDLSMTNITE